MANEREVTSLSNKLQAADIKVVIPRTRNFLRVCDYQGDITVVALEIVANVLEVAARNLSAQARLFINPVLCDRDDQRLRIDSRHVHTVGEEINQSDEH